MRLVLDAGAAYELVVGGPGAALVASALRAGVLPPAAPELLDLEVAAALRRAVTLGDLAADPAARVLAALSAMPLTRCPHRPLMARVWSLRDRLTATDACYVALAERLAGRGRGLLLTTDVELARTAATVGTIDIELVPVR
ncbi:type II toxin-antitoxin system VapC family toxin [Patulibacter defluvii]|uniref:type II toxin-antitoxin system VapC family toxin n=1 Tax=Patulibacter defluvii TaxID=3095358 RepID=UPI002A763C11|nr:type II toxin-antitoxin system VapC family toxin [Patulibacter sp. DM4]